MSTASNGGTSVGPHGFEPVRFWDRWRKRGRCRACYYSQANHPVGGWTKARHRGDRSPADRLRVLNPDGSADWL